LETLKLVKQNTTKQICEQRHKILQADALDLTDYIIITYSISVYQKSTGNTRITTVLEAAIKTKKKQNQHKQLHKTIYKSSVNIILKTAKLLNSPHLSQSRESAFRKYEPLHPYPLSSSRYSAAKPVEVCITL